MRGDRQNHTRSPWLRAGLSITCSFMNGEILEIKKSFAKSNGEILEIKNYSRNQKIIREIKRRNFGNKKIIQEIKRRNFGNQKLFAKSKNHSRNQTEKFWK